MCKMIISLNTVDKVKDFVNTISKYEDSFDLISGGHYIVDAKSVMGIFSLDLTKPVTLISETADQNKMEVDLMKFRKVC